MIKWSNLLLETLDYRQFSFQYDEKGWFTIYYWKLQAPGKLIFRMIRGGAELVASMI